MWGIEMSDMGCGRATTSHIPILTYTFAIRLYFACDRQNTP